MAIFQERAGHSVDRMSECSFCTCVLCLFVVSVISRFCVEGGIWVLIVEQVPGHYLTFLFLRISESEGLIRYTISSFSSNSLLCDQSNMCVL